MQSEWRVSLVTHLIVGQSEESVANYAVSVTLSDSRRVSGYCKGNYRSSAMLRDPSTIAQGDKRHHINNHM